MKITLKPGKLSHKEMQYVARACAVSSNRDQQTLADKAQLMVLRNYICSTY